MTTEVINPVSVCSICNNSSDTFLRDQLIMTENLEANAIFEEKLRVIKIFFVVKGSCVIYLGKSKRMVLQQGAVILVPIGVNYKLVAKDELTISSFTLDEHVRFGELCSQYTAQKNAKIPKNTSHVLMMNEKLWVFLSSTLSFIKDGLSCNCYQKMKIEELFHVLRAYYSTDVLVRFFMPLNTRDSRFAGIIYENWDKALTLEELASMNGLSLSGFSKRFKKIFAESPYQWILERKSGRIMEDLLSGEKSIKQLTEEYGFYSVQHFGYYCKKRFGKSPGKIRQSGSKKR